jgi:hypothetical protein
LERLGGCWVVSPMPLDPDAKGLRVQILDVDCDRIVTAICAAGWIPARLQSHPRFVTGGGLVPASLYEIDIPRERQPVVDSGPKVVPSEPAKREKTPHEVQAVRRYLGWK